MMDYAEHSPGDRVIALGGVFRCASMIVDLADFNKRQPNGLAVCTRSLFCPLPAAVEDIFGSSDYMLLGLYQLLRAMMKYDQHSSSVLAYVADVMRLEKRLRNDEKTATVIRTRLAEIAKDAEAREERHKAEAGAAGEVGEVDEESDHEILEGGDGPRDRWLRFVLPELDLLYRETLGRLTPRIQVRGSASTLQVQENVFIIRALLFGGVRAAVLWRQLGGKRMHLVFGRRRIIALAQRMITEAEAAMEAAPRGRERCRP